MSRTGIADLTETGFCPQRTAITASMRPQHKAAENPAGSLRRRRFSWDNTTPEPQFVVHIWDKEARIGLFWTEIRLREPIELPKKVFYGARS